MFLTIHAAAGIAISQQVDKPYLAFILSFFSHFVLDFIPHGDEMLGPWVRKSNHRNKRTIFLGIIDISALTALICILYTQINLPQTPIIIAGILGGILPDFFVELHDRLNTFIQKQHSFFVRFLTQHSQLHHILEKHASLHRLIHHLIKTKMTFKQGLIVQVVVLVIFIVVELVIH